MLSFVITVKLTKKLVVFVIEPGAAYAQNMFSVEGDFEISEDDKPYLSLRGITLGVGQVYGPVADGFL